MVVEEANNPSVVDGDGLVVDNDEQLITIMNATISGIRNRMVVAPPIRAHETTPITFMEALEMITPPEEKKRSEHVPLSTSSAVAPTGSIIRPGPVRRASGASEMGTDSSDTNNTGGRVPPQPNKKLKKKMCQPSSTFYVAVH